MRSPTHRRSALALGLLVVLAPGCGSERKPNAIPVTKAPVTPLPNEIPSDQLEAVLEAHFRGLGFMERFEYSRAVAAFRKVHELAPGWIPGAINLAIALLNDTGSRNEERDQGGATPSAGNFDEALALLGGVLARDPDNLHAHYCRGIIFQQLGDLRQAHAEFRLVTDRDPTDGHAWFWVGSTLLDPDSSSPPAPPRPAGPKQARELIALYEKALECNPYLDPALFRLQAAYGWAGDREAQKRLLALRERLNPDRAAAVPGPGETAGAVYGSMGRYAQVIGPSLPRSAPAGTDRPARFDAPTPIEITLPEGHRWVKAEDFTGPKAVIGRLRARFGAAVATFDADGDERADLFLSAAVVGSRGVRDALLLNRGEGRFEDATAAFGLPDDRASLGVAVGDFDADGHADLFLSGVGDNRLFRNLGTKRFEDVTKPAGVTGPPALSLTARWLDLDQDGDLDLYVVNYCGAAAAEEALTDANPPVSGLANAAYRNDGRPAPVSGSPEATWAPRAVASEDTRAGGGLSLALTPWPDAEELLGGATAHTAVAALDVDEDRDLDLVLSADGAPATAVLNDRLGRFHAVGLGDLKTSEPISGLLATHLDKDGRTDLVAVTDRGRVTPWRNRTERAAGGTKIAFESFPCDGRGWSTAQAADLDLDGWPDLLGLPASIDPTTVTSPVWARNEGDRLRALSVGLARDAVRFQGLALADLVGDVLPDLVLVGDGDAPRLARNRGNGHHWVALDLDGRWGVKPKLMRTNPHGLGTRLALEGEGLDVLYDHTTPVAGLAQSIGPVVLGLGQKATIPLVRLRWPDGVMQAELNQDADRTLVLVENNRKTGSCPVVFTWNGERFICLGDILGGGGLGYLVAPGVYSQPDRDEAMAIAPDQLEAVDGVFRVAVAEPMDEVAYLDQFVLDVVDRPPGVSVAPDERFAPGGNRPSGELIAWRRSIEPVRATDLEGRDVTEALRSWDRRTVDGFKRLGGWIGYAEEHGIVLDFGDRLERFGAGEPLVLCLAGWVEYPYSQTNYAAATAGVPLRPPVLERRREDGTWEVIEADPGYPAGLPRLTTLDLTGKLTGPRCVLRLRTNMECYWDQAVVAIRLREAGVRVTTLPVARARLGYRGYMREVSPDGRPPLLYDYDSIDPAPLARPAGRLTRFGDVAELLRQDDDRLCVIGPGDEVRLEFEARQAPVLPKVWTRSFVLRAVGYCKDADPCTAASDTIGPLPWNGMPSLLFGSENRHPNDPTYREYLRDWITRPAGLR